MVTIRDVAKLAGVSVATVSRVLNNPAIASKEARELVLHAVAALGYRPNANAQALATQSSDTIGVVVMDVSDPFFGALVKAVDTVAQRHQKYVLIGNSYHEAEKERHAIEVLIRQRCNALVVHAKALGDDELSHFLNQVPGMVLINRVIPGYEHRCVSLNNVTGAEMATRLLLSQGHQRIGYIGSNHGIEDDLQRQQGYLTAMTQGTSVSMTQTRQPPPESWRAQGSPDLQGGEAAMVELLGRNLQLSAVFAYNDSMAAGALAVLKENGISVPQDFSLVGFDDIPIARYTSPKLTTVRYPIVSMATLATELALKGGRQPA
ncbi:LacI family transcriptional regulator [Ewingella americana]